MKHRPFLGFELIEALTFEMTELIPRHYVLWLRDDEVLLKCHAIFALIHIHFGSVLLSLELGLLLLSIV